LTIFKKPGENKNPVRHYKDEKEFEEVNGRMLQNEFERAMIMKNTDWAKLASPIWMDIQQSNTLNGRDGREENDERHISCLQLDVIERFIELWSNPNDIILTPFMGIGSEIYQAVKMGRKGIGIELKESYFEQSIKNIKQIEAEISQPKLF